jgi:hypothetical protein
MEATVERKTAAHVIALWKYKPLDQDDALWHMIIYGTSCTPPPPPISANCYKWYIRKAPFVPGAQPLDSSPLSLCQPS